MAAPQDVINPITIANYGKVAWNGIAQANPVCKLLTQKGNIRRDVGGLNNTWPLEAGRHDVYIVDDYQDVTALYTPRKRWAQPTLAWGECAAFRAISKGELRQNSGDQKLVDFRRVEVPAMFRDLMVASNTQGATTVGGIFWQFLNMNGVAYAGTGRPLYGLPSVFTGNGAITWAAGSKTGTITNTNYCGLSCVLNGLSTTVEGAESDAWTPTALNTTSTAWAGGAGNATFRFNAFEILSDLNSRCSRFSGSDSRLKPDCYLLERSMYVDVQYQIAAKQTIFLQGGAVKKGSQFGVGSDPMEGLLHNGLPIYWDENLPVSTGYLLNFDQIFMDVQPLFTFSGDKSVMNTKGMADSDQDLSADQSMFETEVRFNDGRRAVTVSVTFPGQFRIHPRYQGMLFAGA